MTEKPGTRESTGQPEPAAQPSAPRQFAEPHPSPDTVQFTRTDEPKPHQKDSFGRYLNLADRGDLLPYQEPRTSIPMDLASVLDAGEINRIRAAKKMVFHAVGDTGGVVAPQAQLAVADQMEADYLRADGDRPSFLYHLGDVVYYFGQRRYYNAQFYYPYRNYPGPILAIPGNHDGDLYEGEQTSTSLDAFLDNFCSSSVRQLPEARPYRRTCMDQPGAYFQLETPFARIVGLYTNVAEGVGTIYPQSQVDWLVQRLKSLGDERAGGDARAVIVAMHHPPLSADAQQGGGNGLLFQLEDCVKRSNQGRGGSPFVPDAVLSGHVHNYQRFTRTINGQRVPVLVAGAGGYHNLTPMQTNSDGSPIQYPLSLPVWPEDPEPTTLEYYMDDGFGYIRVTSAEAFLTAEYIAVADQQGVAYASARRVDGFTLDLESHQLTAIRTN